jgi:hypothetical protein
MRLEASVQSIRGVRQRDPKKKPRKQKEKKQTPPTPSSLMQVLKAHNACELVLHMIPKDIVSHKIHYNNKQKYSYPHTLYPFAVPQISIFSIMFSDRALTRPLVWLRRYSISLSSSSSS